MVDQNLTPAAPSKGLFPEEFQNGWKPLLACVLGSAAGFMALTFYTQSLFVGPVTQDFGWGRGQFLASYTVMMLAGVIAAPFVGSLIDRVGPLKIGAFGLIGHAVGYCLLAITPGSLAIWYATFALLAAASAGTLPITWMYVVNAWFYKHRGKAIGITMAGTGCVAFIAPPLVQVAISTFGWRGAYAVTGIVPLAIALPVVLAYLKLPRRPEASSAPDNTQQTVKADLKDENTADLKGGIPEPIWGYTRKEALRDYRFWSLAAALALTAIAAAGLLPNFISVLTDKGLARETAAYAAAAIGISVLIGRLSAGFLVDRFWAPAVAAGFISMPIISILVLMFLPVSPFTAVAAGATLGLALGAEIDLLAYITGRYFGAKHFGPVFSSILVFFMLAAGLAPMLYGVVYDATGSYASILTASIVGLGISVALFLSLGKYPDFYSPREAKPNLSAPVS